MKIGIIGVGNMGGAILNGLLPKKHELFVHSLETANQESYEKAGVAFLNSSEEVLEKVELLILAVKPTIYPVVLKELQTQLQSKKLLLISIAAGMSLARLKEQTHPAQKIIRIMPNMAAKIGKSTTAITKNEQVTTEELEQVKEVFQAIGSVYEIPEKDFSTFTALAGSSPAYIYMFIDAMSRAAVKHGMNKQLALEIFSETLCSSSELLTQSSENPWALIDKISSPAGTTVAGILALEKAGFISDVVEGFDATIKRDKELSKK